MMSLFGDEIQQLLISTSNSALRHVFMALNGTAKMRLNPAQLQPVCINDNGLLLPLSLVKVYS
jgi:hypothetical protein